MRLILPLGATGSVRRTPTVGWVLLVAVSTQILSLVLLENVTLYSFLSVAQCLTLDTATRCHTRSHSTLSYLVCGASYYSTELVLATDAILLK